MASCRDFFQSKINVTFCVFHANCSDPDLVDLHSVRILHDEEFTLCPDQTGDGLDQLGVLAMPCWDLRGRQAADSSFPSAQSKMSDTGEEHAGWTLTGVSLSPA